MRVRRAGAAGARGDRWAALGLLLAPLAAPATDVQVHAARVDGPERAVRRRVAAVLTWPGGPRDVASWRGDRWVLLGDDVTPPFTTPPLAPGTSLQVRDGDGATDELVFRPVWSPVDAAAWSGPGLRGADVTGLAATPDTLWVTTAGGGLAMWDGRSWRHADRRDGLPDDAPRALALSGRDRWLAHDHAVLRLDAEGDAARWPVSGARHLLVTPAGAWASGERLWRLDDSGPVDLGPVDAGPGLVASGDLGWIRQGGRWTAVGEGGPDLPDRPDLHGVVPRADGAWLATDDGLGTWIDGVLTPEPPPDGPARGLVRADPTLAVLASPADGPAHVLLVDGEDRTRIDAAVGLPGAPTLLRPSSRPERAWVGTTRGVAQLHPRGHATPLPVAPLPAGVPVHDVAPLGARAAVASEVGLVWLGRRAPKGWESLVAAVGAPARAVARAGDGWWALGPEAAFSLDGDGLVHRWAVAGRPVDLAVLPAAVMVATDQGLQAWTPGARLLSPRVAVEGLQEIAGTLSGDLWAHTDTGLWLGRPGASRRWDIPGLQDVAADAQGCWLATDRGLYRLGPADDTAREIVVEPPLGPLRAVARVDDGLWLQREDGRVVVWRGGGVADVTDAPLPGPLRLVPAEDGAWVATPRGLWRLRPGTR